MSDRKLKQMNGFNVSLQKKPYAKVIYPYIRPEKKSIRPIIEKIAKKISD